MWVHTGDVGKGVCRLPFERSGITVQSADRMDRDRYVARARELMPAEEFAAAWEAGAAMELADAIRYATERVGRTL